MRRAATEKIHQQRVKIARGGGRRNLWGVEGYSGGGEGVANMGRWSVQRVRHH